MKKFVSLSLVTLILFNMLPNTLGAEEYPYPSLYKAYEDYFDISVAIEPGDLVKYPELAENQFNVLVTENQMKPWIHKGENQWYWSGADAIVSFAEEHNQKVRAHTLVCPDFFDSYASGEMAWFFNDVEGNSLFDSSGKPVEGAAELTLSRLENHIKTIVQRYKGKVYAYDVVNEAFKENGAVREYTRLYKLLDGTDWITQCFEWAYEADPDAVLIYNDNGFTSDIAKQDVIYNMISEMRQKGIPVNIGMQMHYGAEVDLGLVESLIARFSNICDVYITELDMALSQSVLSGSTAINSNGLTASEFVTKTYPDYMYDEVSEIQARKYGSLFDIFRKYSGSIKSVGFWNICDGRTYQGAAKHPLVFDENGEPKAAFYRILDFDKRLPRWMEGDKLPKYRSINYTADENQKKLFIYGETDSEKNVTAVLYDVDYSGERHINNETVFSASGEYSAELSVSETDYSVLEYELSLCADGEEEQREVIKNTFFTGDDYKLYDDLNDFSKIYSWFNMSRTSNLTFYEDDECGMSYSTDTLDNRYVVYRLPDDKNAVNVKVNAYVYENTLWSDTKPKPVISGSPDGKEFTSLSNLQSWGTEIPKVLHTDNGQAKQRRHFRCNLNIDAADGIKYIKIDLNEFSQKWHVYIEDVEIEGAADPYYIQPQGIEASMKLFAYSGEKPILTGTLQNGNLLGIADVTNYTEDTAELIYIMALKQDDKLKTVDGSRISLEPGQSEVLSAYAADCKVNLGTAVEMFLFDISGGGLRPVCEKNVFEKAVYLYMILDDDFSGFDKMYSYSSGLQLADMSSWDFDDTTIIEQKSNWQGAEIVYKADEGKSFKETEVTIYTNVNDDFINIKQYGAPFISVSDDGINYTVLLGGADSNISLSAAGWIKTGTAGSVPNTEGSWFAKRVASVKIKDGAKYVKFGFPVPLFSKYHIKLGGMKLYSD